VKIFPGILARNWQLKLSALAMAVLLWTVPELGQEGSQTLEGIPVRVQLNDPEWALLQEPLPATVNLTLSGPSRELFALGLDRPSIVIPVDQVADQDTAILLRSQWVRMPVGEQVVVEEMSPNLVNLSFEPMAVGAVTLRPRLSGVLPRGLSMLSLPQTDPSLARVSGPQSRVEALETLSLLPLDLSRVDGTGEFVMPVDTAGLSGLAFSPQSAAVRIEVEETVQRTVTDLAVILSPLPEGPQLQARPASAALVLMGARSLVEGIDPGQLRITLSSRTATSLSPGEEIRISLSVEGIPDLVDARLEPEWVLLRRPTGS
jgi:YbbR domain-containing protein